MEERDSALCCCEYWNTQGERSHLLGLCCDCEAVDRAADSLVSGEAIEASSILSILATVEDRLRIPYRGGATRFPIGRVLPVVLLPLLLHLASLHPLLLLLSSLLLPLTLLSAVRLLRYRPQVCTRQVASWSKSLFNSTIPPRHSFSSTGPTPQLFGYYGSMRCSWWASFGISLR